MTRPGHPQLSRANPRFAPAKTASIDAVSIECPCCAAEWSFDFRSLWEDVDGSYRVFQADRFVNCEQCGEPCDVGAISFTIKCEEA